MATSSLRLFAFFSVGLLLLGSGSLADQFFGQETTQHPLGSQRWFGQQQQHCNIERLSALEPLRRVQSEAGFTEYFDDTHELFQCAGVSARRRTIEPRGLVLPFFSNAPSLIYIVQGRGIGGTVFPGCPESYQSLFQQTEQQYEEVITGTDQQGQRIRDEHQKVRRLRQGDVVALPAGVASWFYNDGDSPVVTITVFDTKSNANQLDPHRREFLLAGRQRGTEHSTRPEESIQENNNILSGFDIELLTEAFGLDRELTRRIQQSGEQERRGEIVRVQKGLQVLRSTHDKQYWEEEESAAAPQWREGSWNHTSNGLEETYCFMKNRENIGDPARADVYNPRGGRITSLNSQKLPILRFVQLSAERGHLHRNAIHAPHWNINAHSIVYVLRGSCRLQVVGRGGRNVFDGELRQGQLFVVPQHHAVLKRAESAHFEWIAFKTSENAMVSQIVGKASVLRGLPLEVLTSSYQISREEARRLKFNRGDETAIFSPHHETTITQASA